MLGLAFKEDCPDLRDTRVIDIVRELESYGCRVAVHDPLTSPAEAEAQYGVTLAAWEALPPAEALILAVPHRSFRELGVPKLKDLLAPGGVLMDVKGALDRDKLDRAGLPVWRL